MSESESKHRLRPRTFPYASVLPYPVEDAQTAEDQLAHICAGLHMALCGRFAYTPAVVQWTSELQAWLRLKYNLPLDARLRLTRVYYALAFAASSAAAAQRAAGVLARLWCDRALADSVSWQEADLDPKPLMVAIEKMLRIASSIWSDTEAATLPALLRILELLAPMLPPGVRKDVWDLLIPHLAAPPRGPRAAALLVLGMLPADGTALDQLPAVFSIWRKSPRSQTYVVLNSLLVANIIVPSMRDSTVCFGDYGVLSRSQAGYFYDELLRCVDIPGLGAAAAGHGVSGAHAPGGISGGSANGAPSSRRGNGRGLNSKAVHVYDIPELPPLFFPHSSFSTSAPSASWPPLHSLALGAGAGGGGGAGASGSGSGFGAGSGAGGATALGVARAALSRSDSQLLAGGEIGIITHSKRIQASVIVAMASPQGKGALSLFEAFMDLLTPFCHPSAAGEYSAHALELVLEVARALCGRRNTELSGESNIPSSRHLSQPDCDAYARACLESVLYGIHAKSRALAQLALSALSYLSNLAPSVVLPRLLADAYLSLHGQLQPQRVAATLAALTRVIPEMASNREYALHIPALLELALPCIDISDPVRSSQALWFVNACALAIPFADISGAAGPHSAMEYLPAAIEALTETGQWIPAADPEVVLISASYSFNELVPSLLERLISVLENLPEQTDSSPNSSESVLVRTIARSMSAVLNSVSEELFERLLARMLEYIANPLSQATPDAAAVICGLFVLSRRTCFSKFWPLLKSQILTEVKENGAGLSRSLQIRDKALVWYLSIFNMTLTSAGDQLLEHADEILSLTEMLHRTTRGRIIYHTANTVHHAITGLITSYPVDMLKTTSTDSEVASPAATWGQCPDPSKLKVNWHVCTLNEAELAIKLYKQHSEISISSIRELIESTGPSDNDAIANHVTFLRTASAAISTLIDVSGAWIPNEQKLPADDSNLRDVFDTAELQKCRNHATGYFFGSSPLKKYAGLYKDVHSTRIAVGEALHEFYAYLKTSDNDTKALKELLFAMKIWLSDYGFEKSARAEAWQRSFYQIESSFFRRPGLRKRFPRAIQIRRAYLYHLQRLSLNHGLRDMTKLDQQILDDLLGCTTSVYADVRRNAESAIYSASRLLFNARSYIYPRLLRKIHAVLESQDYREAEAGLKSLQYKAIGSLVKRGSDHSFGFFKLMSLATASASPEVSSLALTIILDLETDAFQLSVWQRPDGRIQARDLELYTDSVAQNARIKAFTLFIESKRKRRSDQLKQIVEYISRNDQPESHWRSSLVDMCVLVTILPCPEIEIKAPAVARIMRGLLDHHPDIASSASETFSAVVNKLLLSSVTQNTEGLMLGYPDKLLQRTLVPVKDKDQMERLLTTLSEESLMLNHSYFNPMHIGQRTIKPGYLSWPSQIEAQPISWQTRMSMGAENVGLFHREINQQWLESYVLTFCIEPKQEADRFESSGALCLHALLSIISDSDDLSLTGLKKYVFAQGKLEEKGWQKFSAELSMALIASNTIMDASGWKEACQFAYELFEKVVLEGELNHETVDYWATFLQRAADVVDFRALLPWVRLLRDEELPERATRLALRRAVETEILAGAGWLMCSAENERTEELIRSLSVCDQKQNLADESCRQIAILIQNSGHLSFATTDDFVRSCRDAGPLGGSMKHVADPVLGELSKLFVGLYQELMEASSSAEVLRSDSPLVSRGKAACVLLLQILSFPSSGFLGDILASDILPCLFELSNVRDDSELVNLLSRVYSCLAHLEFTPSSLEEMAQKISDLSPTATWHQKLRMLLFVQPLFYANCFSAPESVVEILLLFVHRLLADNQHEVRDLAATTLSALVRCIESSRRSELIAQLRHEFSTVLSRRDNLKLVAERHSAVLGLGALVTAFPYAVPPPVWVPEVLSTLAVQTSRDGGVVSKTVKQILGDFKITRQDSWHIDQKAFTEDQLSSLDGILWKSYFV